MSMGDRSLTCRDCGASFVFTTRDQEFYRTKGFENDPARCPTCRSARKSGQAGGGGGSTREMTQVTCAGCGQPTEVPFKPTGVRPVYCRSCYNSRG